MERSGKTYAILIFFIALVFSTSFAQEKTPPPKTTRILFILDASGSMIAKWDGESRLETAKRILNNILDSLKNTKDLQFALRVYGHQYDKKFNNCEDTQLEVPFKAGNTEAIKTKLQKIEAKGTTLISYSLLQAAKDFPEDKNSRNVIILLTDGVEACGGDPCALSKELQKKKIFLKPFIIGIGGEENWDKEFECMGQFFNARNPAEFKKFLDVVLLQTLGKTTVRVNLLDSADKPTETNVNMTFYNTVTGEAMYDFVHYLDAKGKPDALEIDPILTYDIVVHTIPKVIKRNVYFKGGQENIINIKSPQGTLTMGQSYKEYKNLIGIVKENGRPEITYVQKAGESMKYLEGTYDIEILTLPRITKEDVKIKSGETVKIEFPGPGLLSIAENVPGYGQIYLLKPDMQQELIYVLEGDVSKTTLALQPGNYKFVFRSKKSMGSKYTDVQLFTIETGKSVSLKLFSK